VLYSKLSVSRCTDIERWRKQTELVTCRGMISQEDDDNDALDELRLGFSPAHIKGQLGIVSVYHKWLHARPP